MSATQTAQTAPNAIRQLAVPPMQQELAARAPGLRYPTSKKTIYDRNLNRSKGAELSRAAFAYLFVEMVSYAQRRVTGIADLEKRYV